MEGKILLSTYLVKLSTNKEDISDLSDYDYGKDFLQIFKEFTEHIFANLTSADTRNSHYKTHLTLSEPSKINDISRSVTGFFSSGVSGEEYSVVNLDTNMHEMDVSTNHGAFRNVFFYLEIPEHSKFGYMVLQRKTNFGIKGTLSKNVNSYLKDTYSLPIDFQLNNILLDTVFERMISNGNLKKVELVKRRIPELIENFMYNTEEFKEIPGTLRQTFSSRNSLPSTWKRFVGKLYRNRNKPEATIELKDQLDDLEEFQFTLELNKKEKTFYVNNSQRVQPDMDVTSKIEFDNGIPKEESLLLQAKVLIDELKEIFTHHD